MADARHSRVLQHAHSSNHINFGHFGTATYNDQTQHWHFLRENSPGKKRIIEGNIGLSPFRLIQQPDQRNANESTLFVSADLPARITHGAFLKESPEAAPGLIDWEHDVPSTTKPTPRFSDPELLAFGSALVLGSGDTQSGLQTTPIVAYTTREEPTRVVLAHLEQQTTRTDLESPRRIQVPCISGDEATTLPIQRGQILQLCFSERSSRQDATWLAVRSATATTICQPLVHRATTISFRETLIDANVVIELPVSRSGGFQHADFTFHPHDPRRFALVDIAGNWSIWKTKGKRSHSARVLYNAHLIAHGSLKMDSERHDQSDGWHKLLWSSHNGHDVDCLLVTSRQTIALFDFKGSLITERTAQIGLRETCWLLDVKAGVSPGHFLALSTSQIFSISISSPTMKDMRATVKVDAYRNHFRAHDDGSLRLHILRFADAIWLFLTSARSCLITAWLLRSHSAGRFTQYSISDPVTLDTPSMNNDARYLAIQGVATDLKVDAQGSHDAGCFFKVFTSDEHSRGGIDALYQILGKADSTGAMIDLIPLPQKRLLTHKTSRHVDKDEEEGDLIDFIVADYDDKQLHNLAGVSSAVSLLSPSNNPVCAVSIEYRPRVCDLQRTYESITAEFVLPKSDERANADSVLDTASFPIDQLTKAKTLFQLLLDRPSNNMFVAEIENESNKLNNWIQELDKTRVSQLGSKLWGSSSLIDMYDGLVNCWISSLSSRIPDRTRVYRERLSRRVALELYLSSILVKPPMLNDSAPEVPLRQSSPFASNHELSTEPSEEGDLPIFPSSQVTGPSTTTPSVLSQYVSYTKPVSPTTNASASLEDLLGHLPISPDADPNEYSFHDAELSLALAKNELANQALDPKAKKRAEKLARARKRQFEKQAQIKKVAFENAATLPSVMSSQLPIRGVQSSQAGPPNSSQPSLENMPYISMTQPERGLHGKRDTKKAKNKGKSSRQKGF